MVHFPGTKYKPSAEVIEVLGLYIWFVLEPFLRICGLYSLMREVVIGVLSYRCHLDPPQLSFIPHYICTVDAVTLPDSTNTKVIVSGRHGNTLLTRSTLEYTRGTTEETSGCFRA